MIDYPKLQDEIHEWAIEKGWLDQNAEPRPIASLLMLTLTEVAESVEAYRAGNPACERPGMEHLTHMAEELADVVIRLVQMADEHGIDLSDHERPTLNFTHGCPLKDHWYIVRAAVDFERGFIDLPSLFEAVEYVANQCGIDLDEAVRLKMAYNWTRPHKHGKQC